MPPGPRVLYVLGTRTSLGRTVRTAHRGTPGGGWGNMRIHQLAADGTPIEASCTRNGGQACDANKLDHGRRLAAEEHGVEAGRP